MNGSLLHRRISLRLSLLSAAPFILAIITAIVLLSDLPDFNLASASLSSLLLYAVLTMFALIFAAPLSDGELSPAHMIGIVAFLSHSALMIPETTWSIFFGGVFGVGLHILLRTYSRQASFNIRTVLFVISRVTLSFWAAGQVYLRAGGTLPMGMLPEDMTPILLPLTIYGLAYITLYFGIFLLELYSVGQSVGTIIRNDFVRIAMILVLPIPFAILGAEILSELAAPSHIILVSGLVFIILTLNALSHSEYRLRKQLDEMRTLSIVTQSMRSHLDLASLLRTIYVQIAQILNVDSFMVTLRDADAGTLFSPVVIKHGEEIQHVSQPVSLINRILNTSNPLLLENDSGDTAAEVALKSYDKDISSWIGVPLVTGSGTFGVIAVASYDTNRRFTRDDLRLLNIIAASGSIAIENAQLYQQQTERAEQLVTLNRIASLLSGTLSPEKVLDTIISSASTVSNANAVGVYLFWDDARSALPLVRSAGLSDGFMVNAPDLFSFKGQTPPEQVSAPVTIRNLLTDNRSTEARIVFEQEGIAALAELPLQVGEEVLGFLVLYYRQAQVFTGDKVELLKTFANQAAQAINNARMYSLTDEAFQRSVEQLLTLASIGRVLTSTVDLKNIGDLILSQAIESTGVDTGMVILRDEVKEVPLVVSQRGYLPEVLTEIDLVSVMKQSFESGHVYRVDDVRKKNGTTPLNTSTLSLLIVPILRGKDVLGIIRLESQRLSAFSEEDSHFVLQVANQAVIAIDNARLFDNISEARDRLRVLLDAMEEGIILVNEHGRIELANPRIDLIGLQPSQLIESNLVILAEQNALEIIERAGFTSLEDVVVLMQEMKEGKAYPAVNYVVQAQHGVLHIRRQIIPVRGADGAIIGALLVFYNKTEEEELARSREEISRMIVHDLRSPLTAVTTSLRLLEDFIPKDASFYPVVTSTTDASRRAIRKLLNRVDSLLDVSRMESGQISIDTDLVDLNYLVENVRSELSPLATELEVRIESRLSADLPPLDVDGDKIERVILNLVDNALKYVPRGTDITVCNHKPGEGGAKAGYVRIDVIDRGPGVPLEYKNTLFDRFVQIEGRRKVRRGVGLGLTFCRLVTEAHGGRIWIEDNPAGGSIFAFTLPVANLDRLD